MPLEAGDSPLKTVFKILCKLPERPESIQKGSHKAKAKDLHLLHIIAGNKVLCYFAPVLLKWYAYGTLILF